MNKKIVLCLFILSTIISPESNSQYQLKIDSLTNVLKTLKEDTSKVNAQNELCRQVYQKGEYEQAIKYVTDALQLSKKINFKEGEAKSYLNIGNIFWLEGNFTDALSNYSNALKINNEIKNKKGIAAAYQGIGNVSRMQSNYSDALANYLSALMILEEINDKQKIAYTYSLIGIAYAEQGNYADALNVKLKGLRIALEIEDKHLILGSYNDIGKIHESQGNYSEALKSYFASLKLAEELGYKDDIASSYNNIGETYSIQGKKPEALKSYYASLKMFKETGNKFGVSAAYANVGAIYQVLGNYDEALKNCLASLKIDTEIGNKEGTATAYINLGLICFSLNKYSEANKYFNNALLLTKEIGDKEGIKASYNGMADLDSAIGDFRRAFAHSRLCGIYKDSLLNEASNKQINEINAKYQSEKKNKEIVVLTKDSQIKDLEIKKQKLLMYSFISGLLLMLPLGFFGFRSYRTRELLKLQTLRNKIASDLHDDVGSTLSSISIFSEIAKEQSSEVTPMLEQIGESSRKMLDAMADIVWTINSDNDQFEKIILRMKSFAYELLGAKKIDFEFDTDDYVSKLKLPMDVRKNLFLIFKEATNNMVKYAEASKASFSISGNKIKLIMLIRDNGKGFDVNKESQGNGLKNMKKRAQEIGANLLIESEIGTGTTLQFILNLA